MSRAATSSVRALASELTDPDPQGLVDKHAGTGVVSSPDGAKEKIDFGKVIGIHVDQETGKRSETTNGQIINTVDGKAHIVPSRPHPEPSKEGNSEETGHAKHNDKE